MRRKDNLTGQFLVHPGVTKTRCPLSVLWWPAHDVFVQSPTRGSVYWPDTHVERVQGRLDDVIVAIRGASVSDDTSPQ